MDIEAAFAKRPPSNWAAVWLSGEWLRLREGLSPFSMERMDLWLDTFFETHILTGQGLYQEPGHPNSYDLFTRYHLADMLMEGYDGRRREDLEILMRTGLLRSLGVQLSDGSLASAHRSTGQTWTLGAQCAYFTHASNYFRGREPELARRAEEAAYRALSCVPALAAGRSVQSCREPSATGSQGRLRTLHGRRPLREPGCGFPGRGGVERLESALRGAFRRTRGFLLVEHDPTFRAVLHNGPYSLHFNARPAPDYDAFGVVDLTFGPGRFLQFVSSAKHLESGRLLNLGMAGNSVSDLALIGRMKGDLAPPRLELEARGRGSPYRYHFAARCGDGRGLTSKRRRQGWKNPKLS